jgi:16S rRNA (uracil1498-N3)-methyltransferase
MHRCFAEPERWKDGAVALAPEEARHLLQVLRAGPGDEVVVFDGEGREADASIEAPSIARQAPAACLLRTRGAPRRIERAMAVSLLQALPKGARIDWIVEKATELGAARIVPAVTSRVVGRLAKAEAPARVQRWHRLAVSAAKQCGSAWVPRIEEVADSESAIRDGAGHDLFLVGSLQPDAEPFRVVAERWRHAPPRRVALLIGPEGDLSPEEVSLARRHGAVPVSFGPMVFRVETAALFGLSVLMYEFGG